MRKGKNIGERERVLPWYKGEGKKMGNSSFSGVHRVTLTYMSGQILNGPVFEGSGFRCNSCSPNHLINNHSKFGLNTLDFK